MKVKLFPVRTVRDHQGNILHREYKEVVLDSEQIRAICALFVRLIENDRKKAQEI